jgi:hypothetical protein
MIDKSGKEEGSTIKKSTGCMHECKSLSDEYEVDLPNDTMEAVYTLSALFLLDLTFYENVGLNCTP